MGLIFLYTVRLILLNSLLKNEGAYIDQFCGECDDGRIRKILRNMHGDPRSVGYDLIWV